MARLAGSTPTPALCRGRRSRHPGRPPPREQAECGSSFDSRRGAREHGNWNRRNAGAGRADAGHVGHRTARELAPGNLAPAIFLTARGDAATGVQAMSRGHSSSCKPVEDEALFAAVRVGIRVAYEGSRNVREREHAEGCWWRLTARERDVLLQQIVTAGSTNRSPTGCVDQPGDHHAAPGPVMSKLNARSVTDLVWCARAPAFLSSPPGSQPSPLSLKVGYRGIRMPAYRRAQRLVEESDAGAAQEGRARRRFMSSMRTRPCESTVPLTDAGGLARSIP